MVISYNRVERDLVFISIQNTISAKGKIKNVLKLLQTKLKAEKKNSNSKKFGNPNEKSIINYRNQVKQKIQFIPPKRNSTIES